MSQIDESREYIVKGMTCDHCVAAVTEEVSGIAGVQAVDAELASGRLAVRGEDLRDDAAIAAVAEAGYEVVA